jgi:hypothetical protein
MILDKMDITKHQVQQMILDKMDRYVTKQEHSTHIEQLKGQIIESSETQDMHYRSFKTQIVTEVTELKSEHLRSERAREMRRMVVEEMKDFIKALLESRLQAYQRISDMPVLNANKSTEQPSETDKSRDCVDQFEYETDIAIIDDNFNLIVQNVNNVVRHFHTRHSANEDITRWPILIGESGSTFITRYVKQKVRTKRRVKTTTSRHRKHDSDSDRSESSQRNSDATMGTPPEKSATSKTSRRQNTKRDANTSNHTHSTHQATMEPPNKTPSASTWWDSQAAYDVRHSAPL